MTESRALLTLARTICDACFVRRFTDAVPRRIWGGHEFNKRGQRPLPEIGLPHSANAGLRLGNKCGVEENCFERGGEGIDISCPHHET